MDSTTSGLEKCLQVGLDIFLDTQPGQHDTKRYPGSIRGWDVGQYILLGMRRGATMPLVRRGKKCVVRFMHEGEVWGFTAVFGEPSTNPDFPLLQLYWPSEVARLQVRKHERVEIKIACTLHLNDEETEMGTIGDISGGGCSVVSAHALDVGANIRLSFRMPEGAQVSGRPVLIRNRKEEGSSGYRYGCQFQEETQGDRGIELFVARKIATDRGEAAPHPQILLLSRSDEDLKIAQQGLADTPYEAVATAGLLDLGHQLRTCTTVGILISSEQKELSALELIPLIKQSADMEDVPLFLYGGDSGLHGQATGMGATLCLADLSAVGETIPHLLKVEMPETAIEDAGSEDASPSDDGGAEPAEEADMPLASADESEVDDDDDDDDDDGDEIELG